MDMSWRMLKELTPDQQAKIDQYNAMGMGAYAEQFKQLFEEQNRINQRAQETAPVETAQTGLYQQQIDARNAKRAEENRIRAMVKRQVIAATSVKQGERHKHSLKNTTIIHDMSLRI